MCGHPLSCASNDVGRRRLRTRGARPPEGAPATVGARRAAALEAPESVPPTLHRLPSDGPIERHNDRFDAPCTAPETRETSPAGGRRGPGPGSPPGRLACRRASPSLAPEGLGHCQGPRPWTQDQLTGDSMQRKPGGVGSVSPPAHGAVLFSDGSERRATPGVGRRQAGPFCLCRTCRRASPEPRRLSRRIVDPALHSAGRFGCADPEAGTVPGGGHRLAPLAELAARHAEAVGGDG